MVIAHATKSRDSDAKEDERTTQARPPRVFIVSDVRLLCDGLVLSLSQQPSLKVAGSADLTAAPTRIAALKPEVVLIDVGSPGGLDIVPVFRHLLPEVKVVAIAVNEVEHEIFACAEARVSGFVSRNGSIQDLVAAVHCAVRNELVCSPRVAALLLGRVASIQSERVGERANCGLTRREHEIVSLITQGLCNKEIARQLRIQNATVKNHIHSILGKLQIRRRGEVAARIEVWVSPRHRLPSVEARRPPEREMTALSSHWTRSNELDRP